VSVIIPFYKNKPQLEECVRRCQELDYPSFEIVVVANVDPFISGEHVRWLKIDDVAQGPKKDAGVKAASGDICAFIDDDAYPRRDWLRNAVKYFEDSTVGMVCGPGVALPDENRAESASSAIWGSFLGSGPARYRYVPTRSFYVDGEAPGYNMLAWRSLLLNIHGIDSRFRSGEDAILSQKIRDVGRKILYAPDVVVYHRKRPIFTPLLSQVFVYGLHRGFFLRRYPNVSRQGDPLFIVPLLHVVGLVAALFVALFGSPLLAFLSKVFLGVDLGVYFSACFISGLLASRSITTALLTTVGIPLVHLTFSLGYVKGFLTKELGERSSY